jgi:uncharacterized membrane protein
MILLKLLHFATLICWCGSLLYLPALIASSARQNGALAGASLNRSIFTLIATPAALLAIGSGSALFLQEQRFGNWLVAKLTLVALLVCGHALCGVLLLRAERYPHDAALTLPGSLLGAVLTLLVAAILWLVLAKPL